MSQRSENYDENGGASGDAEISLNPVEEEFYFPEFFGSEQTDSTDSKSSIISGVYV